MIMDGRLNIVKMPIIPNLIYRLDTISIKIPARFFVGTDTPI